MMVNFEIPATPIAQPRPRHFNGVTVSAPAQHPVNAFKAICQLACREAYQGAPLTGPLALTVVFVMPLPQSARRKRGNARVWHAKRPDLDNVLKALKDALNGQLWQDDAQIAVVSASKVRASSQEAPHVVVSVRQMDEDNPQED